jgi:hypothetical protein
MANLIDQYASYLLVNAVVGERLEEIYQYALSITDKGTPKGAPGQPEIITAFYEVAPASDVRPILLKFQKLARKRLGLMDISVLSAAPLSDDQRLSVENKLRSTYGEKISIVTKTDPSLLGGLCIIAGHQVIDNTIKKRLADMKKNVYKGVYFKQC